MHRTSAGRCPHFRVSGPNGGFGVWWLSPPTPALAGNACRWAACPKGHVFRPVELEWRIQEKGMSQILNKATPSKVVRSPKHSVTPGSGIHRLLLSCGVVGPVLFIGTFLIEGATRPNYDAWRQAVSALSLGDGGWIQNANFIVFGILLGCFAVGLRAALAPGIGATWAPRLQVLVALGLIVDGVFVQDPAPGYPPGTSVLATPTIHGILHLLGTFLIFIARVAWCFVLARRFARERFWHNWAIYSIVTAILMMVFLAAFGATSANTGPAGLFERMATIVTSLLTVLLAVRLLAGTGRISPQVKG